MKKQCILSKFTELRNNNRIIICLLLFTIAFTLGAGGVTAVDTFNTYTNDSTAINIQNYTDTQNISYNQSNNSKTLNISNKCPVEKINDESPTTQQSDESKTPKSLDKSPIQKTNTNYEPINDLALTNSPSSNEGSTYAASASVPLNSATKTPEIVLTFDDGFESVYTYAYPIMKQYGIKGTVFINTDYINCPDYMTLDQLRELHDAGWTIANHENQHLSLLSLSRPDQIYQIQTAINWLNDNGFGDGAYYFASVGGDYNDEVLDVLRELGIRTHRTTYDGYITNPPEDLLQLPAKEINGISGDHTLDQAKAIIDEAIASNTTAFILLHGIVPSNPDNWEWSVANFRGLIEYIAQTGVKTLTNNEWYNEVIDNPIQDTIPPTASANIKTGSYNVNKSITLTMNEPGTIYYTTDGNTPSTASTIYTGPITISSTTTLKFFAVDLAGNPSQVYTEIYTIDKTAPNVTSTTPKNGTTGVSRTVTIAIKFGENILPSTNWSKIYVKNLKTGKNVPISKWISGNTLYIETNNRRAADTLFQVYIPSGAVKDNAGNNCASYSFSFKTGKY